jgi:hypothetical protein
VVSSHRAAGNARGLDRDRPCMPDHFLVTLLLMDVLFTAVSSTALYWPSVVSTTGLRPSFIASLSVSAFHGVPAAKRVDSSRLCTSAVSISKLMARFGGSTTNYCFGTAEPRSGESGVRRYASVIIIYQTSMD